MKTAARIIAAFVLTVLALSVPSAAHAAKSPNLHFTSNPPLFVGVGQTYTPTVASNGPGQMVLSIADGSNSTCVLVAGVVTFVHSGACQINADVAAAGNYTAGHTSQTIAIF